jgi:hypothetical protein
LEVPEMRWPYGHGFASPCSKVASAPTASFIGFGKSIQTPVMQEPAFVCLEKGNISFYAAIMGAFQMKDHGKSLSIRSFLQRRSPFLQPVGSFPVIENTYSQLL